jgi:hypothetical protein
MFSQLHGSHFRKCFKLAIEEGVLFKMQLPELDV